MGNSLSDKIRQSGCGAGRRLKTVYTTFVRQKRQKKYIFYSFFYDKSADCAIIKKVCGRLEADLPQEYLKGKRGQFDGITNV